MNTLPAKAFALFLFGGLYWQVVCEITGVGEPWDAATYWVLWYPVSLMMCALAGVLLKNQGWMAGGLVTFAQLLVMWINSGTGSLFALGLLFLCVLAIPAMALSTLTGWLSARIRPV